MIVIFKRELLAYFRTPLGYVIISALYLFTGYYFFTYNLFGNTTETSSLFKMLFSVALFVAPVLTMRLLSEERRSKTDQTLFTAPVSRFGIVLGKYLAALCVYLMAISYTLVTALAIEFYSSVHWPVVWGNYLGLGLLGAALIAVCLFVSSFTESQVVAAVGGFGVSLFMMLVDALQYVVSRDTLRSFFSYMSFNARYKGFTMGVVGLVDVCFFLSIAALFIGLTTVVLEYRRWN